MFLLIYQNVKKYWKYILTFVVTSVSLFFILRRSKPSISETLNDINQSHNVEIDTINNARLEERKELEKNQKDLETKLEQLDNAHDIKIEQIQQQSSKQVEEITQQYKTDPDALAELIAKKFNAKLEK